MVMDKLMAQRSLYFGGLLVVSVLLFWAPLRLWYDFSSQYVHLSHTILVPFVSLFLVWWEREKIFASLRTSVGPALVLLVIAAGLYATAALNISRLSEHDYLSLAILSVVVAWLGIFVLCYGTPSFRAAVFPLLFLLLMVPIPELLLDKTIAVLQEGSATVAHWLFKLSGVPSFRDGVVFIFPGLTIEVAEECSGIRSSIALLVTGLLAAHLFVRTGWGKGVLLLSILPLALIKNGVRVVTITLLGMYVDPGFLSGKLHQRGGFVFFGFSLVLMAMILGVIQYVEKRNRKDVDAAPQIAPKPNDDDGESRAASPER
jgi:exosortase